MQGLVGFTRNTMNSTDRYEIAIQLQRLELVTDEIDTLHDVRQDDVQLCKELLRLRMMIRQSSDDIRHAVFNGGT